LKRLSTTTCPPERAARRRSDVAMRRLSARPSGGGGVGPSAALRLLENLFKVWSRRRALHLAPRRHHRGHDTYWEKS